MHRPQMQNDVMTVKVGILPWRMLVPKVNTVSVWDLRSPKSLLTRSHKELCRGLKLNQFGAHFHCSFARTRSGRPASRRIFSEAQSTRADRHPGSSCPNPAWDTNRASARSSALSLPHSSEVKRSDFENCSCPGLIYFTISFLVQLYKYIYILLSAIMRWICQEISSVRLGS